MKKVILVILSSLFLAGCVGMQGAGQGINNAYQMDYQMRQQNNPGVIYYPQQQNNSTYWQEQNARQQYFDNNRPRSMFTK